MLSAIKGVPLGRLFAGCRTCYWNEDILAYSAVQMGYAVYRPLKDAPVLWHIDQPSSPSKGKGFKKEFWEHYDRTKQFHRVRKLGADVSWPASAVVFVTMLRRHPLPRLLATIYAQFR